MSKKAPKKQEKLEQEPKPLGHDKALRIADLLAAQREEIRETMYQDRYVLASRPAEWKKGFEDGIRSLQEEIEEIFTSTEKQK